MIEFKPWLKEKNTVDKLSSIHTFGYFILFSILLLTIITPASAHPPSSVLLSYDNVSSTMIITITHIVDDPATHYVKLVKIQKNGVDFTDKSYTSQPSKTSFTYLIPVSAVNNDDFKVTAECSIMGSTTSELRISPSLQNSVTHNSIATGFFSVQLWQVHASLMVTGFLLTLIALLVIYFVKRGHTYIPHKIIAITGVFFIITGVAIAFYMVGSASGTHLRIPHGDMGVITIIALIFTIVIAVAREKRRSNLALLRLIHINSGRISFLLVCITIITGMIYTGLI